MSEPLVTVRRSFGYDLYSLIGPEMSKNALVINALADKELPWSMATLACKVGCEAAAKVAISLRTFSEATGQKITRRLEGSSPEEPMRLYDLIGCLVHHKRIEITINPPLPARARSEQWIETRQQSRHRLLDMIVESDKSRLQAPLRSFADAVADEINAQIHSPFGRSYGTVTARNPFRDS